MIAEHDTTEAVADPGAAAPEAPIVYEEGSADADLGGAEGKGSRWNAVRHGCMAKLLLPADLAAEVAKCTAILTEHFRPTTEFEVGLLITMGRVAAQLERNQKLKVVDLQRTMDRAVLCWDEDREDYIDSLVAKLGKVPGVARALARSKQGADWLRTTWMALGDVLEINGTWDDEQRRLAHALLDTPAALVQGSKTIAAESDTASLAIIVKQELDRIERRLRRYLLAMDDAYRSMAAAGMPMEEDAETRRLRKQESKLKLDLRRAKAELLDSRAQSRGRRGRPTPAAPEPPPVVASVRPQPAREPDPTPRPKTSKAAFKYLLERSELDSFDLPETATSPAQRVHVRLPFPGGDPQPQPDPESEPEPGLEPEPEFEPEPEAEPVGLAEPAAVRPQTACVASHASREAAASRRRDRDRKLLRDKEKRARKAARRNRR